MFKNIRTKIIAMTTSFIVAGGMVASPLAAVASPTVDEDLKATGYVSEDVETNKIEAFSLNSQNTTLDSQTYNASSSIKFTDVSKKKHVFYDEIYELADYGVTTGWKMKNGTRQYRPLGNTNRDVMIVFIYRALGSPDYTPPKKSPFTDVSTNNIFYKEIAWAYSEGITEGWKMKDGTRQFRPVEPVKRDAMAAFLMRASGDKAPKAKKSFADVRTNQPHAAAMTWMREKGVSTGWKNGNNLPNYRPLSNTKRDAMAAFVVRWLDKTPPSATKVRPATVKEQRDWTASLPRVCKEVPVKNFQIINAHKQESSFRASVTYLSNGEMYYGIYIDGGIKPDHPASVALMKHECGHVLAGIYKNEKGSTALGKVLDKGWTSSDGMRHEKVADCIADYLGAVRETKTYRVGYGTVCSSAQKNVSKTLADYSRHR